MAPPKKGKSLESVDQDGADGGDGQLDGEFVFPDGSEYRGQYFWKGEKASMHGKGRLQIGSDVFEGTFANGLYQVGKYTSCSGTAYDGSFRNNQFHGLGEFQWPDGRKYTGMWKDGIMHGRGKFEDFSIGVDRVIEGFAIEGSFLSSREEQAEAKQLFLSTYGTDYVQSATAGLFKPFEGQEAAKGGKAEPSAEGLKDLLVPPLADEEPKAVAERASVEAVVLGPFPETLKPLALQVFSEFFGENAEKPGEVKVLEDAAACGKMDGKRLKCQQLAHVGQAVLFAAPAGAATEVGAIKELVLANVSREFDSSVARWKLVHCEEIPPATGE